VGKGRATIYRKGAKPKTVKAGGMLPPLDAEVTTR
jgi:hypothetical protein